MAITLNDETANAVRINYQTGDALSGVMTAVTNWLSSHGWAVYDASAGTNAVAYRALNFSGTTYKYIVLDYNTANYLIMKVYESWNSTTHAGTNLCYQSDMTAYAQRIDLTNGADLWLYAHARWLVMLSKITGQSGDNTYNSPCMCFECARDYAEDNDTVGVPEWGWVSIGMVMSTDVQYNRISWCRDFEGYTGASTSYLSDFKSLLISISYTDNNRRAYGSPTNYITNKLECSNVAFGMRNAKQRGRIFGLKIIQSVGANFGDTLEVDCDANYFYEQSGSNVNHHCLGQINATISAPILIPK